MEPPGQLLERPLQPACRIQERARELPGPPALPQEQGPREVGCQPTGRRLGSEGEQTPLAEERIKKLDEVGFVWSVKK